MTITPGHPTRMADGTLSARDLDVDLAHISRCADRLVVLLTGPELAAAGLDGIMERGLRQGLAVVRLPVIRGRPVPGWLMSEIAAFRVAGPTVYADTSGHGRAAVAAAWALIAGGETVESATAQVRAAAGGASLVTVRDRERVAEFWRYLREPQPPNHWSFSLPSSGIRRSHLPPPRAPWDTHLRDFALSFDAYDYVADLTVLQVLFNEHLGIFRGSGQLSPELTLDAARACVFYVHRAWRYRSEDWPPEDWPPYDPGPYANELLFVWALVEWMREHITRP
jgi:hypothetical protein